MTNCVSVLSLVVAISCIDEVCGWGKIGHQMVANIAWYRLTNQTRTIVKKILVRDDGSYGDDDDAGSPLASVADWADKVRYTKYYHWTAPLHYSDVQDDQIPSGCAVTNPGNFTDCHFEYDRDCQHDFCVAGAISNYTNLLSRAMHRTTGMMRGSMKQIGARECLEFITHFVGDIHQPLHSARASDKGGNTIHVHFNQKLKSNFPDRNSVQSNKWNVHSIWDDGIIEKAMNEFFDNDREVFEADLIDMLEKSKTNGDLILWLSCSDGRKKVCASDWAEESLQNALCWAYRDVDGTAIPIGGTISDDYYYSRLPIVKQRLLAAGVRLARTLEFVFGSTERSSNSIAQMIE